GQVREAGRARPARAAERGRPARGDGGGLKVLVDAERLRNPNNGLGQLTRWLGAELVRQRQPGDALTFLVPPAAIGVFGNDVAYRAATMWRTLWSGPTAGIDVWHVTHQDSAFAPPRGVRSLLTILDLNFLERADYSDATKARRLAKVQRKLDRASIVTTISEYTASVVRSRLRVR